MNPRLFVVFSGLHFVLFPIPIVTLFWKDQIGMSLTDIMVLQAVFGIAVAIAQFPSGYFADRVGYRPSLLVGGILQLAGWLWYARGESFPLPSDPFTDRSFIRMLNRVYDLGTPSILPPEPAEL